MSVPIQPYGSMLTANCLLSDEHFIPLFQVCIDDVALEMPPEAEALFCEHCGVYPCVDEGEIEYEHRRASFAALERHNKLIAEGIQGLARKFSLIKPLEA